MLFIRMDIIFFFLRIKTFQYKINIPEPCVLPKLNCIYEELVSKTSYIHSDMLLICIIDFLLQLK